MAKKGPSKHSRAARRATSPGIDIDKSLKNVKPPTSAADHRPSVLGIHQAAGVTKKSKKLGRKSVLSTRARRRQERGLDMAAAVVERTAQKVQRSKTQARSVDYRRKAWEEINSKIDADVSAIAAKKAAWALMVANGADGSDEEGDEEEEAADSGDEAVRQFYDDLDEEMGEAAVTVSGVKFEAAVPLSAIADGGDDIL